MQIFEALLKSDLHCIREFILPSVLSSHLYMLYSLLQFHKIPDKLHKDIKPSLWSFLGTV